MCIKTGLVLVGNIYLNVNAKDVTGSQVTDSPSVILSCKTSPSLIDAVNSEVSSSINSAGRAGEQQQQTLIDTSTCAATCARCGTYVGDGQIVDHEEDSGDDGGGGGGGGGGDSSVETDLTRGHFVLRDLSNIRFIRHRVEWRGGGGEQQQQQQQQQVAETSNVSALLKRRMTAEQVLAHLLTAASSLYGCSTFELYVSEVPR